MPSDFSPAEIKSKKRVNTSARGFYPFLLCYGTAVGCRMADFEARFASFLTVSRCQAPIIRSASCGAGRPEAILGADFSGSGAPLPSHSYQPLQQQQKTRATARIIIQVQLSSKMWHKQLLFIYVPPRCLLSIFSAH